MQAGRPENSVDSWELTSRYKVGDSVQFGGSSAVIADIGISDSVPGYLIESGPVRLPLWVPASVLARHQGEPPGAPVFNRRAPHLVSVDDFFKNPDEVREIALSQRYYSNLKAFKGLRSDKRFLWPFMREELSRLLGTPIKRWLEHGANGVFQQTSFSDPLVWHHDKQSYAAAIYLTPDAPPSTGTSFWRDRSHGCRRKPSHPFEQQRLGTEDKISAARNTVYDQYNIEHVDNWELVESVAGLYNRLVVWDAALFHSASSYEHFTEKNVAQTRLVQLFFFDI